MILNRTAGGQKKYTITDRTGLINCETQQCSAGAAVQLTARGIGGLDGISIQTTSGLIVPAVRGTISTNVKRIMRAPEPPFQFYFIMPAADVNIS